MNILETIKKIKCGFAVRRPSWGQGLYVKQSGENVNLMYADEEGTKLVSTDVRLSLDDINAEDWEVFEQ